MYLSKIKTAFKIIIFLLNIDLKYLKYLPEWTLSVLLKHTGYKYTLPWLCFPAVKWLKKNLKKNMVVFEWGSGGSTIFIAKRVKKLISIEHSYNWYKITKYALMENKISNCNLLLKTKNYSSTIKKFPDNFFDLIFIDGIERNQCVKEAIPKIRKNGFIMLDNTDKEEFSSGIELLKDWKRKDFFGLVTFVKSCGKTSIWKKRIV